MTLNHTDWNIFTCDEVFEPPIISSSTAISEAQLGIFQSGISFPGLQAPQGNVGRPIGISLASTFVSSVRHLFDNPIPTTNLTKVYEQFQGIIVNSKEEGVILNKWLLVNFEKIQSIFFNNHSTFALLLLDLLTFENEMLDEKLLSEPDRESREFYNQYYSQNNDLSQ